jgi:environmental stress-induced protein Ves
MQIIRRSDWQLMPWKNGGGTTAEIAIHPAGAGLADFGWRMSAATVERDGPFSLFDGCDRTLTVLEGKGIALHGAEFGTVDLRPGSSPFRFDADLPVDSVLVDGTIRDLNVIAHRDRFCHHVERLAATGTERIAAEDCTLVIFCDGSPVALDCDGQTTMLGNGDAAIVPSGSVITLRSDSQPSALLVRFRDLSQTSDRAPSA